MKAWTLPAPSGTDSLTLTDLPSAEPKSDEVRLRVLYAALNPADYYLAQGHYPAKPAYPHVLGRDGVGVVEAVGPSVTKTKPGDVRVVLRGETGVSRWGTLAQSVVVAENELIEVPAGWSYEQAAAGPLVYLTAWQAIDQWGAEVNRDGVLLITGASGGVGVAAVHLASALGMNVVALSRDESKYDTLRRQGAALCLSPTDKSWRDQLYKQFGKRPVSLLIDNVAGPQFPEAIDTLAQDGRVSVIGALAGPVPAFNTATLFFRRIRIGGVAVGTYGPEEGRRAWDALLAHLQAAGRKPLIDSIHPFEQAKDAFTRLKSGVLGKVLVQVSRS